MRNTHQTHGSKVKGLTGVLVSDALISVLCSDTGASGTGEASLLWNWCTTEPLDTADGLLGILKRKENRLKKYHHRSPQTPDQLIWFIYGFLVVLFGSCSNLGIDFYIDYVNDYITMSI